MAALNWKKENHGYMGTYERATVGNRDFVVGPSADGPGFFWLCGQCGVGVSMDFPLAMGIEATIELARAAAARCARGYKE